MRLPGFVLLLLAWAPNILVAGEAQPLIDDPVIEARAKGLESQLRCLVCQGQSIAESDSGFSNDIRRQILEQMHGGKTDQQIIDYLVARYGDFIRFSPPFKAATAVLWFGPPVLVLVGGVILFSALRKRRLQASDAPLSDQEKARLAALLDDKGGDREV